MEPVLDTLTAEFREKVILLIENCKSRGITMHPYFTLRDPFSQAKLWRQSRTSYEILQKIKDLKAQNALFLAYCIESVGKQYGGHVTNAIPGLSWHQWGEAVDSVWIVNNKSVWSTTQTVNGLNGYMVYADEAKKLGLDAGFNWKNFKDSPHVQFRKAASPLFEFSIEQIDSEMKKRFG
jgi:peptidoglycan LD-endopeptidase CwlK